MIIPGVISIIFIGVSADIAQMLSNQTEILRDHTRILKEIASK